MLIPEPEEQIPGCDRFRSDRERQWETPCKRKPGRSSANGSGGKQGEREAAGRDLQKEERRGTILGHDAKEGGSRSREKQRSKKGPHPSSCWVCLCI